MPSRLLAGFLILAACALALWWVRAEVESHDEHASSARDPRHGEQAELAPGTAVDDLSAPEAFVRPAGVEETAARLFVSARQPDGALLPGTKLTVRSQVGHEPGFEIRARTADVGCARVVVPSGVAFRLSLESRLDLGRLRSLRADERIVEPLAPGEERHVELRLVAGCDRSFAGRCTRAEDGGTVVRGAIHLLVEKGTGLDTWHRPGDPLDALDARGGFELCLSTAPSGYRIATAPGRSPVVFLPHRFTEDARGSMILALERSSALSVRIDDRSPGDREPLSIQVDADARELVIAEQRGRLAIRGALRRALEADAAGRARLDDLPVRVPLDVRVLRAGQIVYTHPELLVLEPGETRALGIELGAGARIAVRVLDELGHPFAGLALGRTQRPPEGAAGQETAILLSNIEHEFEARARTDEDGLCVFTAVQPGVHWIGIVPVRAPWEPADAAAPTPLAQRVVIDRAERRRAITLRAWRGLYVRGRVDAPDERPFGSGVRSGARSTVILIARAVGTGGGQTGQPEQDGTFALGPVTDGEYRLETFTRDYAPIEPLLVRASDGPIVIRLELGGRLSGRVVDPGSGTGMACEVALTKLESAQPEMLGSSDGRGSFAFMGIAPGEYVVGAFTMDGRTGVSGTVRVAPGARLRDVELALEPPEATASVRVVLEGAIEPGRVTLWSGGICRAAAFVGGPVARTLAAPLGELEVRLAADQELVERRIVTAESGTTAEVRIRR